MADNDSAKDEDNGLHLWSRVEATNPKFTKDFNRAGFVGTAVAPAYVFKRLTELFGPCGAGWRFVIEEERVVPGPGGVEVVKSTRVGKDEAGKDLTEEVTEQVDRREHLHIIKGHIEYVLPGVEGWHKTGPYFGQTKIVQRTKDGLRFIEDAPKMSVTDCLTKCAVQLGVAADVHMGLFDDSKYHEDLKRAFDERGKTLVSEKQAEELAARIKSSGLKLSAFLNKYSIKAVKDLPSSMFDDAIDALVHYEAGKKKEVA